MPILLRRSRPGGLSSSPIKFYTPGVYEEFRGKSFKAFLRNVRSLIWSGPFSNQPQGRLTMEFNQAEVNVVEKAVNETRVKNRIRIRKRKGFV